MKKLRILARASLLVFSFAAFAFAGDGLIVRVSPTVLDTVVNQHGLKVEKKLKDAGVYLVSVPKDVDDSTIVQALRANPLVLNVEKNDKVKLPGRGAEAPKLPGLKGGTPTIKMSGNPWTPYLNQPANGIVRIAAAQDSYGQGNTGITVAVIDTAIDYKHPVLTQVLDTRNAHNSITGGSDASTQQETVPFVDQETVPFVDGAGTIVLNQETVPFVDGDEEHLNQETVPFVDGSGQVPPAYGHGTMVAGIIHLVAPKVRIMPIRAFTSQGYATVADIIESIDWAVKHGAQVINMSFSAAQSSAELADAIANASAAGVICVASVANDASRDAVYPSNIDPVIGVAATDNLDCLATFSNWGPDVDITAPGVSIVSTYPQNHYAVASGTSFATPYVAGTVALMRSLNSGETADEADADLVSGGAPVTVKNLNLKRLDVYNSAAAAK